MSTLLPWMPVDASEHGPALDAHMTLNLWIACGLLVLAHAILLIGLILRKRREAGRQRIWWIEYWPVLGLAVLFGLLTIRAQELWAQTRYTGADPGAMQVEVDGVQFAWYFRYPGQNQRFGLTKPELVDAGAGNPLGIDPSDEAGTDDIVSSDLVLPVGREVDLRLKAQDVIHGFSVPSLRIKQNAVPGQTTHLHLTPIIQGTYAILCTQVCGLGHFRMAANLRVLTEKQYADWLTGKQR